MGLFRRRRRGGLMRRAVDRFADRIADRFADKAQDKAASASAAATSQQEKNLAKVNSMTKEGFTKQANPSIRS